MAFICGEEGNVFELYDGHGRVYQSENVSEIDVSDLLLKTVEDMYPISLKLGNCYLLFYMHMEKELRQVWQRDMLYRIGKLLELIAKQGSTLSMMVEQTAPLYLLCDEVVCSWNEKGKIMGMLLQDMGEREIEILEGVQFKYAEKEWSYIVSDVKQPKFLVYSHAKNPLVARENMKNLIEKIRQYQKV